MAQPTTSDTGKRFGFFADLMSRDGGVTKDARIHNGFIDVQEGELQRVWQRPALGSGIAGSGGGQGLIVSSGAIYSVAGGTLYQALPNYGVTVSTNTAVSGPAGMLSGFLHRFNLAAGAVYKAYPSGSLAWQLVSTSGLVAANTLGVTAELASRVWMSVATDGINFHVYNSTNGVSWSSSGAGGGAGVLIPAGTNVYSLAVVSNAANQLETFYNISGFGTLTSTLANIGTYSVNALAGGTGFGAAWLLGDVRGTGAFGTFGTFGSALTLARSPDAINWTMVGTAGPFHSVTVPSRIAAFANSLNIVTGSGAGTANILQVSTSGHWSTAASFAFSTGTTDIRRAMFAPASELYALADTGYVARLTYNGTFGTNVGIVNVGAGINVRGFMMASGTGMLLMQGTSTFTIYNLVTGTSGAPSGANFPADMVPGLVYLDQTYYVMDTEGVIWNSTAAADDPTTWPTDGFISAQFEPDSGVALTKALNYVVAMGQWSVELFWDAANPTGSPLSAVNNGVLLIGCASAGSIAQTESTIVWVAQRKGAGSTAQKGRFVAMLVGTEYKELSTPSVSRILDVDDLATVYASIIELGGHTWYVLGLATSGITLVYDFKTKKWYTWSRLSVGTAKQLTSLLITNGLVTATTGTTVGTLAVPVAHGISDGDPVAISGASVAGFNGTFNVNVSGTAGLSWPISTAGTTTATGASVTPWTESYFDVVAVAGLGNMQLVQDSSGNIYTFSLGTYTDLGSIPLNVKLRTNNMDGGNNERKFCHSIAVMGDILASTDYGLLRYTDDDFQTFSTYRRFDLSQTRSNQQRYGNYRRRAYEWRYTGTSQFRLQYLEPDITQGVS